MNNKGRFITLFENKVKYKYLKYKVKLGVLLDDEILDIQQIISGFIKSKYYFYVIKTCFIASEFYLKKSKIKKGCLGSNEDLEKHLVYLNFAYYISSSMINKDQKYLNYTKNIINKKSLIQKDSKEIKEKIKELCSKYGIKFEEIYIKLCYVYN